ncbi:MAG: hypothetical protein RIF32_04465 [Leptospirales bacterium]
MSGAINRAADLAGENYLDIAAALIGEERVKTLKPGLKDRRERYAAAFGVTPADEFLYLSLLVNEAGPRKNSGRALRALEELEAGNWSLENELCDIDRLGKQKDLTSFFGRYNFLVTLLTGAERVGSDEHSDGCLVALSPDGAAHPTFVYNHEIGVLQSLRTCSISSLFADVFGVGPEPDEYEYEPDEDDPEPGDSEDAFPSGLGDSREAVAGFIADFEQENAAVFSARPYYRDPIRLFARCHWLLQHTSGEPTFNFAAHLSDAPTFADWERERELLADEFPIANYWLLHHFFLSNRAALSECLEILRKAAAKKNTRVGRVTQFLAAAVEKQLKKPTGLLGLDQAATDRLIALSRQNADLDRFEPGERKKIQIDRGEERIVRLSDETFEKIKADPAKLWRALEEYPEDVAGHDRILKMLAATAGNNPPLKQAIEDYFDERHSDAFNEWPADWQLREGYQLDSRLSTAIGAAFISGLNYSDENEKAFCGITIALGVLDDDRAMQAFEQAVDRLPPDDDRAEYVFIALRKSKHARAPELLTRAAWRFFDKMQEAVRQEAAVQSRREKEGLTLDNMWGNENFFHMPLQTCLARGDDEAEKLARAIFGLKEYAHAFQRNFGRAMRIFGERGIDEFNGEILAYIDHFRKAKVDEWATMGLNSMSNLAEATIALAKLDPQRARQILPPWFEREYKSKEYWLAVKAALLGAMFVLNEDETTPVAGESNKLAFWLERLLGNRNNDERLVPALRAAEAARLPGSFDWVRYHLYSDTNSFMRDHQVIKEMAFSAASALGHPDVPVFDESDRFGMKLKGDFLIEALAKPESYHPEDVLKEIHKKNFQDPAVIDGIRDFLLDALRFSRDETGSSFDAYWAGWKAMAVQGAAGQPALEAVLALEYCEPGLQNDTIFLMRLLEPEAQFLKWTLEESAEKLFAELEDPGPRTIGYLDFVAARAYLLDAERARPGIEAALRRQARWPGGHFTRENPLLARLAMIYARYGRSSVGLLTELQASLASDRQAGYGAEESRAQISEALELCGLLTFAPAPAENISAAFKMKWEERGKVELKRNQQYTVHLACETEYGVFSGAFEDEDHESAAAWDFKSAAAAAAFTGALVDLFGLLGYEPVVPKGAGQKAAKK